MKIIILAVLVAVCSAAKSHPHQSCPNSLCVWRSVGDIFAYNEHKPYYFVTCTNSGPVCRRCADGLEFNEKNKACVRSFKKSTTTTTTTTTTTPTTTTTRAIDTPECNDSLCKWVPNGSLFRLDNNKPQYYVQCSNGIASCRQCPPHMYFNNKFDVCVRRTVPKDW
ncbi:protein obstructor-E-like [Clytia hemisphaerica]